MGNIAKRIMWSISMFCMVYTAVSCYMLAGFCAANCGVELPLWGRMMSICASALAWCAGC